MFSGTTEEPVTSTTTSTTATPTATPPSYAKLLQDELKSKWKKIGDWCSDCIKKAKKAFKDLFDFDDDVYRDDDNISTLI